MALTASNIATWSIAVPREALKGRSCFWAAISSDFAFQSTMTSARVGAGTNAAATALASSNLQHQFFLVGFMVKPSTSSVLTEDDRSLRDLPPDESVRMQTEEIPLKRDRRFCTIVEINRQ